MSAPGRTGPAAGYLALVLHAHLPFVRHPESRHHFEELWLFEALTDTYLPLLEIMEGWVRDEVPFALTLSVTPTLASMLADPLLAERYVEHLDRCTALAHQEIERHGDDPRIAHLARMYRDRFQKARRAFVRTYGQDVLRALAAFVPHGLEIIASAATHGVLPLMEPVTAAVRAQVRCGIAHHRAAFGRSPRGFWLPECAYAPGHDRILAEEGIRFTFTDTHGVTHAVPGPRYGVYAPVVTPASLAVFGRDPECSKQVWSAYEGYPGDFDYREFYRDAGYDRPFEEIAAFLPWGIRCDTGLKYHRITGKCEQKEIYDPDRAREKARLHAADFVQKRERQLEFLSARMDRRPIVVAPYDAELFGHWWFEGPLFLDHVVRLVAGSKAVALATPAQYLDEYPENQAAEVSMSTWGYNGYHEVWIDPSNDWLYPELHRAARRMCALAEAHPDAPAGSLVERALNQAARELFLAQSSDWAFIMKTGTVVEYAARRAKEHLERFFTLAGQIEEDRLDPELVAEWEARDNLLPHADYRTFL